MFSHPLGVQHTLHVNCRDSIESPFERSLFPSALRPKEIIGRFLAQADISSKVPFVLLSKSRTCPSASFLRSAITSPIGPISWITT